MLPYMCPNGTYKCPHVERKTCSGKKHMYSAKEATEPMQLMHVTDKSNLCAHTRNLIPDHSKHVRALTKPHTS